MVTSMIRPGAGPRPPKKSESGFSMIEVAISMAVLTVGLVSLLGVFGLAMASTQTSQQGLIAKQLANEALESVVTARNTAQVTWDDIQNTGSTNCPITGLSSCGIFADPSTPQPMYQAIATGTYAGILGTTYNVAQPIQTLKDPGADGVYGTADDVIIPLTGYQRTIQITSVTDANNNVVPSLRSVIVTVSYATSQKRQPMTYVLNSFISQYP